MHADWAPCRLGIPDSNGYLSRPAAFLRPCVPIRHCFDPSCIPQPPPFLNMASDALLNYAKDHRLNSRELKCFSAADLDKIQTLLGPAGRRPTTTSSQRSLRSGRRQQDAGGVTQQGDKARDFSPKVLKAFRLDETEDGQPIVLRQVVSSGKSWWRPVVALEDLPTLIASSEWHRLHRHQQDFHLGSSVTALGGCLPPVVRCAAG